MEIGEELGALLTERAVAALGIPGTSAESYGKAAAVGENGELEHAAAILHQSSARPSAKPLEKAPRSFPLPKTRRYRSRPRTFLSATKMPPSSAAISTAWNSRQRRPAPQRILVAIAVTDSGRPLPRVGGLTKDQIKGEDGLR